MPSFSISFMLFISCSEAEKLTEIEEAQKDSGTDFDGDGVDATEDCNDNNAHIHPFADEICDEIDNDCDGEIDEDAINAKEYYADNDNDGFGAGEALYSCNKPEGHTENLKDCDDENPFANPDTYERCDGVDNDCDGELSIEEIDADGDGYVLCQGSPTPWEGIQIQGYSDCNDNDSSIHPDAMELCDGLDNNCDGVLPGSEIDDDGDHFVDCTPEEWHLSLVQGGDCVDTNDRIFPGAAALDSDIACMADFDQDGFGAIGVLGAIDGTDCDDLKPALNPQAPEICDHLDNDCDGTVDEDDDSLDPDSISSWFPDNDADGYGQPNGEVLGCFAPSGHVDNEFDCNDDDPMINPDALEICDGLDNNCAAGLTDEAGLITTRTPSGNSATTQTFPSPGYTIDLPALVNGTEFHFCAGSHTVRISPEANLSLFGHASSMGEAILDGQNQYSVIELSTGVQLTIHDLSIENGSGSASSGAHHNIGGGVFCEGSDLFIFNSAIRHNTADYGGGIYSRSCSIEIENSILEYNTATVQGGGMHDSWQNSVRISSSTVSNNSAGSSGIPDAKGGGIYVGSGLLTQYENNIFSGNQVLGGNTGYGGALYLDGDSLGHFFGVIGFGFEPNAGFSQNSASTGGGAIALNNGGFNCSICDFGIGQWENTPNDLALFQTEYHPSGYLFFDFDNDVDFSCISDPDYSSGINWDCQ